MKKTITKIFMALIAVFTFHIAVNAQINQASLIPVDFLINSPASIAGEYDYNTQTEEWGPMLDHTITGDVQWGFDDTDSLCCMPIVTDLTGKMAIIRRGICNFSLKVWHAQEQGAIGVIICNHYENVDDNANTLVGMLGGDSLDLVTIPAIFASRGTCEQITSELDAGIPVEASFAVRSFSNPVMDYSYHTPIPAQRPLANMGIDYTNLSPDVLPELNVTVDITDPSGGMTTITQTEVDLPSLTPLILTFDEAYIPEETGTYTYHFSNDQSPAEEFDGVFVVTDDLFAQDNDMGDDWIAQGNDGFVTSGLIYDFGNFYRSGVDATTVTHVSFQLYNAADIFTDDNEADAFTIIIYDADPDESGTVPGNADSYDALNETGGSAVFAGFGVYSLDGTETPDNLITVELEDPVVLDPDKIYLAMVQYNGINAGVGIPPWYGFGGNHAVAGGLGSCVFTDRLYVGGWNGGFKGVIRMHLDFENATEDVLEQTKVALSPNPTSNQINLELGLDEIANEVTVRIMDFTGKMVSSQVLENVQKGIFQFDVSNLSAGTYFMAIETPEGYRAKKFVVAR